MPPPERFDADYYRRFYGHRPVHGPKQIAELAMAVTSFAAWWKLPIKSALDVGAGKGYWRDWLAEHRPRVRYHGLDASGYACRTYGHEQANISTWEARRSYDLVICQSVLQYLTDADATSAISTLGAACRGIMFVEVPTRLDRAEIIDADRTDMAVHWRTGEWYRTRFANDFVELGCGLWASRSAPIPLFEMERVPR